MAVLLSDTMSEQLGHLKEKQLVYITLYSIIQCGREGIMEGVTIY